MKKNLRVVQINGFRGIMLALFVVSCLIAGFIAFPAFVAMNAWNFVAHKIGSLLMINFGEGLLLWAIIAFSAFIFSKKKFIVSFNTQQELSDDEVKDVISRIKKTASKQNIIIPKEFTKDFPANLINENKEETNKETSDKAQNN
jgi:hypothetical protein